MLRIGLAAGLAVLLFLCPGASASLATNSTVEEDEQQVSAASSEQQINRQLQRPCKAAKKRCRSSKRCCPGLECLRVPRIINKQGRTKHHTRCVDPATAVDLVIGRNRFCAKEMKKCRPDRPPQPPRPGQPPLPKIKHSICCEGYECAPIDRIVNRQGGRIPELRCVDPSQPRPAFRGPKFDRWNYKELLENVESTPFAVGRGGAGLTAFDRREDGQPNQNTPSAVERGFNTGLRAVQISGHVTADGIAVSELLDFVENKEGQVRCTNDYTFDELVAIQPQTKKLVGILRAARKFTFRRDFPREPSGLVAIDLKHGVPSCDGTFEHDDKLIEAVLAAVKESDMEDQVLIVSSSPVVIQRVKALAPDIMLSLSGHGLQFADPEFVVNFFGIEPPELIEVDDGGLGLQWYQITIPSFGVHERLPAYANIEQFVATAVALGVEQVGVGINLFNLGVNLLFKQGGDRSEGMVATLIDLGFSVNMFTYPNEGQVPEDAADWALGVELGMSSIVISDIALGKAEQAPWIPPADKPPPPPPGGPDDPPPPGGGDGPPSPEGGPGGPDGPPPPGGGGPEGPDDPPPP